MVQEISVIQYFRKLAVDFCRIFGNIVLKVSKDGTVLHSLSCLPDTPFKVIQHITQASINCEFINYIFVSCILYMRAHVSLRNIQ